MSDKLDNLYRDYFEKTTEYLDEEDPKKKSILKDEVDKLADSIKEIKENNIEDVLKTVASIESNKPLPNSSHLSISKTSKKDIDRIGEYYNNLLK